MSWIWWIACGLHAEGTESHANGEGPSVRLTELMVLSAGVAVLAAVGLALTRAGAVGPTKVYLIGLGVLSVGLSWGLIHTVFAPHRLLAPVCPVLLLPAHRWD
jgi:uncharacterized membrane protein